MNNSSISKILNILLIVLMAISAVLLGLFYIKVVGPGTEDVTEEQMPFLNYFLNWGFILLAITATVAIVAPIISTIGNPKGSLKSLGSIVLLGVIILITYSMSSGELLEFAVPNEGNTPPMLKLGDTCLFTTYALAGLGVLAIIASEIVKIFK